LLLPDEPIEGVDPATARETLARLRELLPNATIIAANHDEDIPAVGRPGATTLSLAPSAAARHPAQDAGPPARA
jgi:ABC-type Mn2+/Zn2+ transport system ATPase subunit